MECVCIYTIPSIHLLPANHNLNSVIVHNVLPKLLLFFQVSVSVLLAQNTQSNNSYL